MCLCTYVPMVALPLNIATKKAASTDNIRRYSRLLGSFLCRLFKIFSKVSRKPF